MLRKSHVVNRVIPHELSRVTEFLSQSTSWTPLSRLQEAQANIDILQKRSVDLDTYRRLFEQIGKVFDKLSFQERRNLILLLVKEVIYTPQHIRIKFWGDLKDVDIFQEIKKLPPDSDGGIPTGIEPKGGVTTVRVGVSLDSPSWSHLELS
jgi:hypothetical protein